MSPIVLTPDLQPIKTAASETERAADESSASVNEPRVEQTTAAEATGSAPAFAPATSAAPVVAPAPKVPAPKVTRTYKLDLDLIQRAETAVLRAGVHRSMTGMVAVALERELERLANEHNDGVPYPPNEDQFRTGRPVGS